MPSDVSKAQWVIVNSRGYGWIYTVSVVAKHKKKKKQVGIKAVDSMCFFFFLGLPLMWAHLWLPRTLNRGPYHSTLTQGH